MQITFLGATKTVTGSKYLITYQNKKILVDCGLYQGFKELRLRNWNTLPINPKDVDVVILTHAHIDHSGYIPLFIKNGFSGKIFCTHGTKDLCSILLPDCGHLEEEDAARANRYGYSKHKPAMPLYTRQDAINALSAFYTLDYHRSFNVVDGLSLTLLPSGHIIGSSLVRLESKGKSIVFTGDLGRPHHPVMKAPTTICHTDYLVTESTYGDRLHEQKNPQDQLATIINTTVNNGGSIIIPAFAVGRTQDMLYHLYELKKANRIPEIPIFLDSPMAQDVSDLLVKYTGEHRLDRNTCINICKMVKYIRTSDESKQLDIIKHPIIIISASGMATGGRILHHLKVYLQQRQHTIVFTGYQDPGTRGDLLVRGESEIKIHGEIIPVRANIVSMENMSAHADYQELLDWLKTIKPPIKKVFITHGNASSSLSLKEKIHDTYGWDCIVPDYLQNEVL